MKTKFLSIVASLLALSSVANATEYPLDVVNTAPRCGTYLITESSTRENVLKNCEIIDTHNGMVRLFRGSETIDLMTNNQGVISCKFKRSAVNSDGKLKSCTTTTPPSNESTTTITLVKESGESTTTTKITSSSPQLGN